MVGIVVEDPARPRIKGNLRRDACTGLCVCETSNPCRRPKWDMQSWPTAAQQQQARAARSSQRAVVLQAARAGRALERVQRPDGRGGVQSRWAVACALAGVCVAPGGRGLMCSPFPRHGQGLNTTQLSTEIASSIRSAAPPASSTHVLQHVRFSIACTKATVR
jgi:hypothetical protein